MAKVPKLRIALVALVVGLAGLSAALAQPSDSEQSKPYQGKAQEMLKKMNLTPEQEAQIRQLQQNRRETSRQLREQSREKRKELTQELEKATPDAAKINALTAQLKDAEGRLIEGRVQSTLQMKEILTPEQYQTFTETLKNAREEHSGKNRR